PYTYSDTDNLKLHSFPTRRSSDLGLKIAKGEELGTPEEEGYMEKGIRQNFFTDKRGSERAVDMLIKKLKDEEFKTEYPMPDFDRDRKSTRLNSSHVSISYAVFCLK